MRHFSHGRLLQQINLLRTQFGQSSDLPFGEVLSMPLLMRVLEEAKLAWTDCIYTPLVTILTFLWQVTNQDHSCRAAVAKLVAHRAASGLSPCSPQTGAYCTARQKLPEPVLAKLARQTGRQLHAQSPAAWKWHGRDVKLVDGSTVSMPDTTANQAAYPQHRNQRPGVGFPLARIAAVFSLACGTVLDLAICRHQGKHQSELGLLRLMWNLFAPRDVLLADRYLCSWSELAVLRERGVDFVARLHAKRSADFRRGRRLGPDDHLVTWRKPRRPDWMNPVQYARLPRELVVREVRVSVGVPGFRVQTLVVATSLLDAEEFPAGELADLYRQRWHAELDLRSLKSTLQMDVLRCKTPEMVRKEIWTHLLAYNLVRTIMAQAALTHSHLPRALSFKGALQTLNAFQPQLEQASSELVGRLLHQLLKAVAVHQVADRPNRYEPRVRKRRPKAYPLLHQPRAQARLALRRNHLG